MSRSEVEYDFPRLIGKEFDLSDESFNYNCLAYALGDHNQWWEPPRAPGQYWPPGFSEDVTIQTVEKIIRVHGYTKEVELGSMPEADAIAIYGIGEEWAHFAKFSGGKWEAKLGCGHDVQGVNLSDMEVPIYGKVVKILSRPATTARQTEISL
jgi:hypothetical protein